MCTSPCSFCSVRRRRLCVCTVCVCPGVRVLAGLAGKVIRASAVASLAWWHMPSAHERTVAAAHCGRRGASVAGSKSKACVQYSIFVSVYQSRSVQRWSRAAVQLAGWHDVTPTSASKGRRGVASLSLSPHLLDPPPPLLTGRRGASACLSVHHSVPPPRHAAPPTGHRRRSSVDGTHYDQ